ncbi:MAG: hypothetical protein ACK40L_02015 [Hydrogenophaga sp.]
MKRSLWNVLVLAGAWVLATSTVWAQVRVVDADQVQIGRYSTQASEPPAELADPLAIFAQLSYPRQAVESVGAALNYTLMRTGYRLAELDTLTPSARSFLQLPLPDSQRRMGPYQVRTILETLIGPAWTLHTDPVTRKVWLTLATDPVQAPQARSEVIDGQGAAPLEGQGSSPPVRPVPSHKHTVLDAFSDPYIN